MTSDKVNFHHCRVNALVGSSLALPEGPEGALSSWYTDRFGVVLDASTLDFDDEATWEFRRSMCEAAVRTGRRNILEITLLRR